MCLRDSFQHMPKEFGDCSKNALRESYPICRKAAHSFTGMSIGYFLISPFSSSTLSCTGDGIAKISCDWFMVSPPPLLFSCLLYTSVSGSSTPSSANSPYHGSAWPRTFPNKSHSAHSPDKILLSALFPLDKG